MDDYPFAGQWITTIRGGLYTAYRPVGWVGEGDRFERITAKTREELFAKLRARERQVPQQREAPA